MPGKEIKGTSKIATYRHGGRAGYKSGESVKLAGTDEANRPIKIQANVPTKIRKKSKLKTHPGDIPTIVQKLKGKQ